MWVKPTDCPSCETTLDANHAQVLAGMAGQISVSINIIEHMIANNLSVPTKKQLKSYGHNIIDLYDFCASIAKSRNVDFPSGKSLNSIQCQLLGLLSDFEPKIDTVETCSFSP